MSFETPVLEVNAVSKRFEIFDRPSDQLRQLLLPRLLRWVGMAQRHYFREFWALSDVSFALNRGESCGIVGLNGSGKSTLLQVISGTLSPTSGTVRTEGRVAALLELGSGFIPEETGRENVRVHGLLQGLTLDAIERRMASIEEFADIGDHFDRPLGTYSSGMQMRVAFAVATEFEPDILIVDEALAVGDAYFQQKCFHRLAQFKERGGTLLFVSHDANMVKQLCDRALLLEDGRVLAFGAPRNVIDLYQGQIARRTDLGTREVVVDSSTDGRTWTKATLVTTNHDADLLDFQALDATGNAVAHLEADAELRVRYRVRLNKAFDRPAFGLIIRDRSGRSIYEISSWAMRLPDMPTAAGQVVTVTFRLRCNLRGGQYSFSIGVANRGYGRSDFEEYSLLMHDVEQIQVLDRGGPPYFGGVFDMGAALTLEAAEP